MRKLSHGVLSCERWQRPVPLLPLWNPTTRGHTKTIVLSSGAAFICGDNGEIGQSLSQSAHNQPATCQLVSARQWDKSGGRVRDYCDTRAPVSAVLIDY